MYSHFHSLPALSSPSCRLPRAFCGARSATSPHRRPHRTHSAAPRGVDRDYRRLATSEALSLLISSVAGRGHQRVISANPPDKGPCVITLITILSAPSQYPPPRTVVPSVEQVFEASFFHTYLIHHLRLHMHRCLLTCPYLV